VRKGIHEVDETLLVSPEDYKPPLQIVRQDLVGMDEELAENAFPPPALWNTTRLHLLRRNNHEIPKCIFFSWLPACWPHRRSFARRTPQKKTSLVC